MSILNYRNAVLIAYVLSTSVAYGQRISYGVEGGVTTLDPIQQRPDESRRYVVGGSFEVALWRGLAVETDFLYRHNGFSATFNFIDALSNTPSSSQLLFQDRVRTNVFELPVLGKYYFRRNSKLQPFVATGYAFRKAHTDDQNSSTTLATLGSVRQASNLSYWTPLDIGATVGAGLRWRLGVISLKPEFRYTYWNSHPAAGVSKQQADVLLGVTF